MFMILKDGTTALMMAVQLNRYECVEKLLQNKNIRVNMKAQVFDELKVFPHLPIICLQC